MILSCESNRLPVLAADIKRAHAGVKAAAHVAAEHALEAGRGLIEAKALLNHGQWLPWLKANVGFSERTAQLYMRIVELGFKSATVADIGLQAAAKVVAVITDDAYDPFFGSTDTEIREWLLFMLFLRRNGWSPNNASGRVEWLLQGKHAFPLNDWLGSKGDRWRRTMCYSKPTISKSFIDKWQAFRDQNMSRSRAEIENLLEAEPHSVSKKSRKA